MGISTHLTNEPVSAEDQELHAKLHGVELDDDRRACVDGNPLHHHATHTPVPGYVLDYANLSPALLDSIAEKSAVDDHDLPWWVDADLPEAREYEAARAALTKLEAQANEPSASSPAQDVLRDAHDRYRKADEWRQVQLAMHRQSVQFAHGVPRGPDQGGVTVTIPEA